MHCKRHTIVFENKNPQSLQARQQGAAMVIALVMLLILTLLATASARMTLLDERMMGNTQDRNVAFQGAEAAIRTGETVLAVAGVLPAFNNGLGLWQPAAPGVMPVWESVDWENVGADVLAYDGLADAPGNLANATASYLIEEMPPVPCVGCSIVAGVVPDEPAIYRVTARGVGAAGNATVTLQTTYKRVN
jgi:type IV pilus assembly protein PilX